jgi:small-conductance mechanosensitive channel
MQTNDITADAAPFSLNMLGPLINHMLSELSAPRGWWAMVALMVSIALAVVIRRAVQRRFEGKPVGTLTRAWIDRLSGPVIAWVILMLARSVLSHFVDVTVLEVGAQLVLAALGVRALLLLVEQTFPETPVINAFERVIAITLWSLAALHLLGVLHAVVDTLDGIAIPMGKSRLSLLQLFTGVCTLMLATVLALWLSRAIDSKLAAISGVDQGVRAVISRVAQPLLLVLSLLIALPVVGIDLTTLSVFSGAVGVGLGFGMQKIAANYISGFIILLDRSIEPGRLIRIDRFRGIVSEIRTRYTVIKGLDGVDSIVPNEMLVNSVVESETFTDSSTRIAVRVGVSYDCDVDQAMQVLIDVAKAQERVMSQPPPRAFLVAFGDSSITLEVGFWIPDPQNGTLMLTSAINLGIYHAYKQAGIEIPVPQREISIKALPADLPAGFVPPRPAPAAAQPPRPHDA